MKDKKLIKTTYFSIFANLATITIKSIAGIFGNSYALIADAFESLTDVFSSILVLIGLKYAQKPADENHPYGHGKIEPLTTFLVVGFLIISATLIAYQSIINIQTPHSMPKPWTLIVLGILIIWKEFNFQHILKKSKETNSTALRAEAWHHRSDAITSITAFLGISISLILGDGFETIDDWAALLASGIIFYNAYKIFIPALGEIMDEDSYDDISLKIKELSASVKGIIGIEKCHIRKVGTHYCVDLHTIVNGNISVKEGHELAHQLQKELQKKMPYLCHILIHIEPDYRDL